ncbi:hypothetical protein [Pseudogulbenkiania ferrooxidans]|uniref:Lipoprotein n=1 Tax=Pseudogulbenkiania ferrooxidans EGD-HP2 TaxID=1388764 RepID=A0ABP2XIE0_9NEIS|nr:hypothetical protein [Pseudogulbenkiania ferrooxidans]ERE03093.1 hypothetical protein O166_13115 [Pseudogulbenkiania ferrooxidans EGD-HP2]
MTRLKLAATAALSSLALLTGCATPLAGKTPDEATRKVMLQNWQNASYNFDAQIGFDKLVFTDRDSKLAQPDIADTIDQVGRTVRVNVSGAVDAPNGRVEAIPELRFERRNLLASIKVPLQFHAQDMSLLVDPSAVDLFLPSLRKQSGKFIRAKLPAEMASQIPLKAMYQAMPKIIDDAYAQADKQAFSFQPLDAYAGEIGAHYKLRMELSRQQEQKLTLQMLDGLAKVAREQAKQPDDKSGAEAMIRLVQSLVKLDPVSGDKSRTVSDIYASRGGDLLALRQKVHVEAPEFSGDAYVNVRYSHYGKPQFVYQLSENDIVDFDKLDMPDWLKDTDKLLPGEHAEAPAAEPQAQAAQPQAKPKKKRKARRAQ